MRFILPIILIAIAVAGFFMFTAPLYEDISVIRADIGSYDEALNNSKALENERDKLTSKYNDISKDDLDKLEKLLPDNIDNIRLILEIEKIASPYGMVLKDVKYNADPGSTGATGGPVQATGQEPTSSKDYRILNMEFSVTGTYNNFINFTKDLESNLRIVDISSVAFSSETDAKTNPAGVYKYSFKIKTYWLKN